MNKYIVMVVASCLAFYFVCPPELDLSRYYELYDTYDVNIPLIDFMFSEFDRNFDFIYFTTFLFFKKMYLAKEFVNAFFVGIFYYNVIYILDLSDKILLNKKVSSETNLIKAFSVFSATPVIVFSISRTVAALAFFFIGVTYLLKGKKIRFYILAILSVFTHVGLFFQIVVFYFAYNSDKFFIKSKKLRNTILVVATILGLASKTWIHPVIDNFLQLPFFASYERYTSIFEMEATIFDNPYLSIYDTIPIVYSWFIFLIGLMRLNNYNKLTWSSYYIYILLSISMGYSDTFTQRVIMLTMPFQGFIALSMQRNNKENPVFVKIYNVALAGGVIICILNIYSYRYFLF